MSASFSPASFSIGSFSSLAFFFPASTPTTVPGGIGNNSPIFKKKKKSRWNTFRKRKLIAPMYLKTGRNPVSGMLQSNNGDKPMVMRLIPKLAKRNMKLRRKFKKHRLGKTTNRPVNTVSFDFKAI
jgi:hypothetical protein